MAWCRAQDYEVVVGDDMARVDLDWWNTRLARHHIPVQLSGRDADGAPTDHGVAYLRRADLNDDTLPARGPADLCTLYRAAAWLTGHPTRPHARRFPDIVCTAADTSRRGAGLDVITTALDQLRRTPLPVCDPGPYRSRSGVAPHPRRRTVAAVALRLGRARHHDRRATAATRPPQRRHPGLPRLARRPHRGALHPHPLPPLQHPAAPLGHPRPGARRTDRNVAEPALARPPHPRRNASPGNASLVMTKVGVKRRGRHAGRHRTEQAATPTRTDIRSAQKELRRRYCLS